VKFQGVVRRPVYLQVVEQLREAILAGDLAPGEPLPSEVKLCEQFSVSRTTVREALRALQAQGLVSGGGRTTPLRTTVTEDVPTGLLGEALDNVIRLRRISLADLVELRCTLEVAAVQRAANQAQPGLFEAARSAIARMRQPRISVEDFNEADVSFHIALSAASGNEAMHLIMLTIRDAIAQHLLSALSNLPHSRTTIRQLTAQHAAVLSAVEAHEADRAAELVRAHIMGFYRRFLTGSTPAR
jgi:DNA-binding FadR family transcriptional regulator